MYILRYYINNKLCTIYVFADYINNKLSIRNIFAYDTDNLSEPYFQNRKCHFLQISIHFSYKEANSCKILE